jgi:tetratricopeptide (TPR) repeat protein
MRPYAIGLLALCASCGGPLYELKLPSQGGAPWVEYTSEHFRLQTDMDDATARATLKDVEERRTGLIRAAFHGAEVPTQRTRMVALRDGYELRAFMPGYILGYFVPDAFGEKLVLLARSDDDDMRVFTHEMTHDLSSYYFARQPRWLEEGLASFLETLKIDREHHKVILGTPWIDRVITSDMRVVYGTHISIPKLFERERRGLGPDYGASWALVFYLANNEGKAFNEYQRALFRGEEPDAAWQASFPDYVDDVGLFLLDRKVDKALKEMVETQRYKTASAPFVAYQGPIVTRRMPEAEVRALRAELLVVSPHFKKEHASIETRALADAREALRENPAEVRAISVLIDLAPSRDRKLELARSATLSAPDDFRSWLLADMALDDDDGTAEQESARAFGLERAVALAPENPWALQRLARSYANAGNGAAALPLIRKSLAIFPDSAAALDTYALVASAQGSCPAARDLQRMAVNRLPHPSEGKKDAEQTAFEKRIARMRDRLAGYEKACPAN